MFDIPEEMEMPSQDDGWWASVLQEEETRSAAPAVKAQKVELAAKAENRELIQARIRFKDDTVVDGYVYAHLPTGGKT